MRTSAAFPFSRADARRLARAATTCSDARTFRRLQAVLLVARGWTVADVSDITDLKPWAIYAWVRRFRARRRPEDLIDQPRPGRPSIAASITDARILREFRRDPLRLGYRASTWTAALLARHLTRKYGHPISPVTLRRRMRRLRLRWKRPRYVYATKDPHRAQKKGGSFAA